MDNFEYLKREIEKLDYPPNYSFDVETLEPTGDLARRVKCLYETAPEMMQGGGSLIDMGANKGFLSLLLHDKYTAITAIEPDLRYVVLCRKLAEAHSITNIGFVCNNWQNGLTHTADVVYCGGVHHHGYNNCIMAGRSEFDFMEAVARSTRHYLVIDGPWHLDNPDHNTAGSLAVEYNWTDAQRENYTIKHHAESIAANFELVREGPSGTGDRKIVVFRRR